jgi:hypothetical protein
MCNGTCKLDGKPLWYYDYYLAHCKDQVDVILATLLGLSVIWFPTILIYAFGRCIEPKLGDDGEEIDSTRPRSRRVECKKSTG